MNADDRLDQWKIDSYIEKINREKRNLQLSGTESVWYEDGLLKIYGHKIHPKLDAEIANEIVGVMYPAEFALQLLDFLKFHEDEIRNHLEGE